MSAVIAWKLASEAGCDPALICAICEQESGWNEWAIRYEPLFYDRYVRPLLEKNISEGGLRNQTELRARAFSWGLMQVMGQTAREVGYKGPLTMLCDPATGIQTGITVWKDKLERAAGILRSAQAAARSLEEIALQLYNGGGNPNYAAQVLARRGKYMGADTAPLQEK